jgi:hypothetical protein
LLIRARAATNSWSTAVVESNLAYVKYHLGENTSRLIKPIERAVDFLPKQHYGDGRKWLQFWLRNPDPSAPFIPPFGVLLRLYAKEGRLRDAFATGEAAIKAQGSSAQGTRLILGFMARPLQAEAIGLNYIDEVQEQYNTASAWKHLEALRDLTLAHLTARTPASGSGFLGQAQSPRAAYHAWTGFADLRYLLSPSVSRPLRNEYGRRILASYNQSGKANLDAIVQIRDVVR